MEFITSGYSSSKKTRIVLWRVSDYIYEIETVGTSQFPKRIEAEYYDAIKLLENLASIEKTTI
jgi:hypothetical protein